MGNIIISIIIFSMRVIIVRGIIIIIKINRVNGNSNVSDSKLVLLSISAR